MNTADLIWMNGEFVAWEDAKVHVLTHALHYGTGVFEGIRCYETEQGPAIFRNPEHLDAPSDPRDRVTTFTYHERGLLASVDGPRQDADDVATFGNGTGPEFGYHRSGQPLIITDPFGEVKRFEYTPYGMIGKIVDRAGKVTTALYSVGSADIPNSPSRLTAPSIDDRTEMPPDD